MENVEESKFNYLKDRMHNLRYEIWKYINELMTEKLSLELNGKELIVDSFGVVSYREFEKVFYKVDEDCVFLEDCYGEIYSLSELVYGEELELLKTILNA